MENILMNKNEYPDLKQAEKALKELKKVWGAFDKEFEEATKGIRKNI